MARLLLATLMATAVILAGCMDSSPETLVPADDLDGVPQDPASRAPPPASPGGTEAPPARDAPPSTGAAPPRAAAPAWPDLKDATIRPGVQVVSPGGQCTSNFVFTSPDNATLYLGLAAHCVDKMEVGDEVRIDGASAAGILAYSSWITMDEIEEEDAATREYNDFALIEIDPADRDKVHPAMRRFGGPVALADSAGVKTLDKVLTYGNSGIRMQLEPASWHEGYVLEKAHAWSTTTYTATPGIPGDSGSGVLTADGRALGVVVTITITPTAGSNGVTNLDLALAYALANAGVDARLATWELLDPGLLPS